MLNGEDIKG